VARAAPVSPRGSLRGPSLRAAPCGVALRATSPPAARGVAGRPGRVRLHRGSVRRFLVLCLLGGLLVPASPALAGPGDVAALQLALSVRGHYGGSIDGLRGPGTRAAVARFQRRAGLRADGRAGRRTRRALGRHGRPRLGSRAIGLGDRGWDVAALQFLLARHGFPSGPVDGGLGSRSHAALLRFQRWAGLGADGIAGPATLRRLRRAPTRPPLRLGRPVAAPLSGLFGPRGRRFHCGADFAAPTGTAIVAGAGGVITWAGWRPGGFGNVVTVHHGGGVKTLHAHLSSVAVRRGARVGRGALIGRVGSTGRSSGPHLHWELRVRGACLDPARALG
jgi:murein DD-endopeptidase MepM/ murein hydrolase activator NlpD